jgi:hypothetical protein
MSGEIRKTEIKLEGNPEVWLEGPGLDRFSRPLSSYRVSNDAFVELLSAISRNPEADNSSRAQVRRALAVASLVVPEDALEDLISDVVAVYTTFNRQVMRTIKESSASLRPVHAVQDPSDQRMSGERRFIVTGVTSVEIDHHVVDENLRLPLIAAVAPYVAGDTDPATAAAELGLNLAVSRTPDEIQREAILVSVMSSFHAFLSSMVEEICRIDQNILRGSKQSFSALEVLEAEGYRQLLEGIRTEYVTSRTRSFESLNRFFNEVLGEETSIDSIREFTEARNVLVHHSGRVSQQYLNACRGSSYWLNDRLIISEGYVRKVLQGLDRLSLSIVTACRNKYFAAESDVEPDSPQANGEPNAHE